MQNSAAQYVLLSLVYPRAPQLISIPCLHSTVCQSTTTARTWKAVGSRRSRRTRLSSRASEPLRRRWRWHDRPVATLLPRLPPSPLSSPTLCLNPVLPVLLIYPFPLHCIIIILGLVIHHRLLWWRILLGLNYLMTHPRTHTCEMLYHMTTPSSPSLPSHPSNSFTLPLTLPLTLPRPTVSHAFHGIPPSIVLCIDHWAFL